MRDTLPDAELVRRDAVRRLDPFERLPRETRRALDDEAEHMAELFT